MKETYDILMSPLFGAAIVAAGITITLAVAINGIMICNGIFGLNPETYKNLLVCVSIASGIVSSIYLYRSATREVKS